MSVTDKVEADGADAAGGRSWAGSAAIARSVARLSLEKKTKGAISSARAIGMSMNGGDTRRRGSG